MKHSTMKKLIAVTLILLVIIIGYWLSWRQIEQIAATNQLAAKSQTYEALLEIKKEALVSVNSENKIVAFSGDESIFGYNEKELLGQRFDILFHCEDGKQIMVMVGQCTAQNKNNELLKVKKTLTSIVKPSELGVAYVVSFQRE